MLRGTSNIVRIRDRVPQVENESIKSVCTGPTIVQGECACLAVAQPENVAEVISVFSKADITSASSLQSRSYDAHLPEAFVVIELFLKKK